MSERDAFGNEIRPDDAGAAFGASAEPAPPRETPPTTRPTEGSAVFGAGAPAREPVDFSGSAPAAEERASSFGGAPAATTPRVTTASGLSVMPRVAGGCISFVAIVFVVGGCAIAGLVGSIGEGVDTFRSISTEFSRTTLEPPARAPSTASGSGAEDSATSSAESAEPPRGLARRSLLRRAEFTRAVTKLRGAGLGRPRSLRVAPDRIDTQLVTKTGRLRNVQIVPGGALRTISTTPSGGFSTQGLVSLAEIDRGAPARLVRSAAGRAQLPAARIDYLVLSQVGGKTRWVAFLQDGPGYLADRSGRIEQKVR